MHAVAAFFASIITFVSGFFAPTVASNSPVNVRMMQPAAAAAAQTDITGDPFNDAAAASAVAAALAAAPSSAVSPPPAQTVINQPVIERIIERVVPQGGTISASALTAILADFEQSISNRIATLNPPPAAIPAQVAAGGNAGGYGFFPASQRIDQLTKTAINSPTITGGTISGASVSGYLPLSGGTLTGALSGTDLSLSGNLTAGTLSVAGLSSSGALFAPYFSATSTTATSTFAGGLTAASLAFNILQNGNVGIGTTSPNYTLDVNGNINIPLNTDIKAGGIQWMHLSSSQTARLYGTTYQLLTGAVRTLRQQVDSSGNFDFNSGQMYIQQSTGNVGIGTTTPQTKLHVLGTSAAASGTSYTGLLTLQGSNSAMLGIGSHPTLPYGLWLQTGDTTLSSQTYPLLLNPLGGNVGIGTTSPATPLHVETSSGAILTLNSTNANAGYLQLQKNSTNFGYLGSAAQLGTGSATDLALRGNNGLMFISNAGSSNKYMVMDTSGNVGIGNTSPSEKLNVQGTAAFQLFNATSTTGTSTIATGQGFTIGGSQFVVQQGSGNVGIGTLTPGGKLSVNGGVGIGGAGYSDTSQTTGDLSMSGKLAVGVTGGTAKATIAGNLYVNSAETDTVFSGTVGATNATLIGPSAYWAIRAATNHSYNLDVYNSGAPLAAMTVLQSGNIGIGTTTPGFPLVVQGNIEQWIDATTNWRTVQRNTSQIGLLGNRSNYFFNFDTAQRI